MAALSSRVGPQIPRTVLAAQIIAALTVLLVGGFGVGLIVTRAIDDYHQSTNRFYGVVLLITAVILLVGLVLLWLRAPRARGVFTVSAWVTIFIGWMWTAYLTADDYVVLLFPACTVVVVWYLVLQALLNTRGAGRYFGTPAPAAPARSFVGRARQLWGVAGLIAGCFCAILTLLTVVCTVWACWAVVTPYADTVGVSIWVLNWAPILLWLLVGIIVPARRRWRRSRRHQRMSEPIAQYDVEA